MGDLAGVKEAIEAVGASLRYLPPYSPDLNLIENAFAKLKSMLRKASERTIDGLWTTIGRIVRNLHANRVRKLLRRSRI